MAPVMLLKSVGMLSRPVGMIWEPVEMNSTPVIALLVVTFSVQFVIVLVFVVLGCLALHSLVIVAEWWSVVLVMKEATK